MRCGRRDGFYPKGKVINRLSGSIRNGSAALLGVFACVHRQLLVRSVNDNIYKAEILKQFGREGGDGVAGPSEIEISGDELNALRYTCGFIPYKLLRKFGPSGRTIGRRFARCWSGVERKMLLGMTLAMTSGIVSIQRLGFGEPIGVAFSKSSMRLSISL